MIRYGFFLILMLQTVALYGQYLKPDAINVAYFGETITHPGIKLGIDYTLNHWDKEKIGRSGRKKVIQKQTDLLIGVGGFHHKDYQTGVFVLPEVSCSRTNANGNYRSVGIGAGYMRTFIPSVYGLTSEGNIERIRTGYNYIVSTVFVAFGKRLNATGNLPVDIYIKPQLVYGLPNTPKGVLYFVLEAGVNFKLAKKPSRLPEG